jgi:flagellar basal-body rod protein FlgB
MINSLFNNTSIPVLQEVLSFSEARHNVLAGNVANADTPGYRIRDLNTETFQTRLRETIERRSTHDSTLSPGEQSVLPPDDEMREVRESLKNIEFLDGSDVAMEQQAAEVAKNQYLHNLTVSIMTNQFRLLQAAISERV